MDIRYELYGLRFEWDSDKAAANARSHGVEFVDAAEVFFDPLAIYGEAQEGLELRQVVMGETFRLRLVLVVHTERNDRTRIISARPATRRERGMYERGHPDV